MFALVTCPACQYKMSIPEGDMGKRLVCPNCKSPFLAGKSAAESVAAGSTAAGTPNYAKTMLGETAPPIKYNCPRCKAPLEAAAIEAGAKKPCPACGQRLQVPAAPAPDLVVQPNLNKTMMASDERAAPPAPPIKYNCPNCKKPLESPASEGGKKKNCPSCGQRLQIPAAPQAPNLNKTILASDESKGSPRGVAGGYPPSAPQFAPGAPGAAAAPPQTPFTPRNVGIAAAVLFLLLIAVPAFIRGGKVEDSAALAKAQQEVEKLKAEIELRKLDLEKQKLNEAETRRQIQELASIIRAQDEKSRDEASRRKWEQEKRDLEQKQQKLLQEQKDREDRIQREIDALRNKQQTIIQQPAPVIYYPPYHPRYYLWW